MDRMEATQHDLLDAQRRWNTHQDGDFKLLEVCTDAEQRLMAGFFEEAEIPRLFARFLSVMA
jgi:hypothetical protein